jgi:hypothetical protein
MVAKATDTQEFLGAYFAAAYKIARSGIKMAVHLIKSEVRLLYPA